MFKSSTTRKMITLMLAMMLVFSMNIGSFAAQKTADPEAKKWVAQKVVYGKNLAGYLSADEKKALEYYCTKFTVDPRFAYALLEVRTVSGMKDIATVLGPQFGTQLGQLQNARYSDSDRIMTIKQYVFELRMFADAYEGSFLNAFMEIESWDYYDNDPAAALDIVNTYCYEAYHCYLDDVLGETNDALEDVKASFDVSLIKADIDGEY